MSKYILSDSLRRAVEIALFLNRPLLLCGEPGTGKTTLAKELARRFSETPPADSAPFYPVPLIFNTKTTSSASDLFYTYDALSRLRDAYAKTNCPVENYIDLKALGQAIILKHGAMSPVLKSISEIKFVKEVIENNILPSKVVSSIVLIDEIDKAPRDFPNDILNEIEHYQFDIREMNASIPPADNNAKIFVVMTSNNEKSLPDAFLRRCVFHYIDFPKDQLKEILEAHFTGWDNNTDVKVLIDRFNQLRELPLNKKPATAEFINWVQYLSVKGLLEKSKQHFSGLDATDKELLKSSLGIMFKNKNDINLALESFGKM
ncbi:MoxR family ATPase [soil metagenome]